MLRYKIKPNAAPLVAISQTHSDYNGVIRQWSQRHIFDNIKTTYFDDFTLSSTQHFSWLHWRPLSLSLSLSMPFLLFGVAVFFSLHILIYLRVWCRSPSLCYRNLSSIILSEKDKWRTAQTTHKKFNCS